MSIYQVSIQCLLIVSHVWAFRHEAGPALPSHCPHWCVLSGQIQALGVSVMTSPVGSLLVADLSWPLGSLSSSVQFKC